MRQLSVVMVILTVAGALAIGPLHAKCPPRPALATKADAPRIGYMSQRAPLSFQGQDGQPCGVIGEYAKGLVADGAKMIPYADWRSARGDLAKGEIDAFLGMPWTGEIAARYAVSDTIIELPSVIVTRMDHKSILDLTGLRGDRVATSDVTSVGVRLIPVIGNANLVAATGVDDGLDKVESGAVDAYVGNLASVDRSIRDKHAGNLRVAAPAGFSDRLVLVALPSQAELVKSFDAQLHALSPREREAIISDWISVKYEHGIDWRTLLQWLLPLLTIATVAGGYVLLANARLRREATERRRVEARLSEVTSNLPGVMYQFNRDAQGTLRFSFIAGDIHSQFGVDVKDAITDESTLFARIHPDDRAIVADAVEVSARTNTPIGIDFRALSPSGYRWITSAARPTHKSDGLRYWTGHWIDSQEFHLQNDALQHAIGVAESAARAKAAFLATMSHELRTPMNGILGMIEMLSATSLDPHQQAVVHTIEDSAGTLRRLLDDVLDVSKFEAGSLYLEQIPIEPRKKVNEVVTALSKAAQSKGLQLISEVSPHTPFYIWGDPLRLKQILYNLVSNAVKFTHAGAVTVRLQLERDMTEEDRCKVTIAVEDTGVGIDQQAQRSLFQPFSQADASIARKYGGTGLGLTIVKQIATALGGEVTLDSALGHGTRISVIFGADLATAEEYAARDREDNESDLIDLSMHSFRALAVDDHPTSLEAMKWRLDQAGIACDTATNGEQALELYRRGSFDIVITDCRMEPMNGYQLAKAIRDDEAGGHRRVPILAVTAGLTTEELDACNAAGIDEVLPKPIDSTQLRRLVNKWLEGMVISDENSPDEVHPGLDVSADEKCQSLLSRLTSLFGTEDMARTALSSMIPATQEDLSSIRHCARDRNWPRVRSLAHRLAGAFTVMGEVAIATQVQALSIGGKEATTELDTQEVVATLHEVELWLDEARAAIG